MFSALRHRTAALALGVCFILPVHASSPKPGDFANTQARHIATFFPGRMTGTPAEMLSADYIRQQFQQMGYRSDIRTFNSRYIYIPAVQLRQQLMGLGFMQIHLELRPQPVQFRNDMRQQIRGDGRDQ